MKEPVSLWRGAGLWLAPLLALLALLVAPVSAHAQAPDPLADPAAGAAAGAAQAASIDTRVIAAASSQNILFCFTLFSLKDLDSANCELRAKFTRNSQRIRILVADE